MLELQEFRVTKKLKGTVGGVTYFAILPGKTKPLPTCLRKVHNKKDKWCSNPAGKWTDHPGFGACSKHGGLNNVSGAMKITTGRNAVSTRNRLAADVDIYLQKDRKSLLDLTREFATLRAVLDEYMDWFPDPTADNYYSAIDRLQSVVGTLGTLVDKMSKVENRSVLTTAQVLYLRATIVDLFIKYISDPIMRDKAVAELANRMGGDIDVELLPSEVTIPGAFVDEHRSD